jgi:hypothetical protein
MLQYREFPLRTAITLVLYSVPFAFSIHIVSGLVSGTLFTISPLEHQGLLGLGALAATIGLPISGFIADRVRFHDQLLIVASLLPVIAGLLRIVPIIPMMPADSNLLLVVLSFAGLASMAVFWAMRVNQSIVARYRGRSISLFFLFTLCMLAVFRLLTDTGLTIGGDVAGVSTVTSLVAVLIIIGLRPWLLARANFGAAGSAVKYFVPMVFVMAAHLLWYFVTKGSIEEFFVGDPQFQSLTQFTGLEFIQLAPLTVGVVASAAMADIRGRKATFSTLLFMIGLLTIFGSAVYQTYFELTNVSHTTWNELLVGLVLAERFIEGYMLGLCVFMIWPEVGSAKTKGLRTSLIWFFFLGYMTLFWALDLNATVFGIDFYFPSVLTSFGGEFAILFALIALYLIGPLPKIIGREIEMEDLSLDFDDRQVRKTVDAFVGADDFASIKSQVDIIDAGQELSDNDVSEILGEELKGIVPLQSIPGVGAALEKKLKAAGYESAAQVAGESSKRLAERVDGLSVKRAESILKEARRMVKRSLKKK